MEKLCLVFGGDSLESEISILTALKVQKELEKYSSMYMLVYLDRDGNFYTGEGLLHLDNYSNKVKFKKGNFIKKNGSNYFKYGLKWESFNFVLLLVHGKGTEDGTLGGFFDTLKIPCIYPGLINSAILQDKANFKRIIDSLKVEQTKYEVLTYKNFIKNNNYKTNLKYPLIIKPSTLGSSIGVSKANDEKELLDKIQETFKYDEVIIIEEVVSNLKEINIALLGKNNEIVFSSVERVNNEDKILTFMDKYDNYSLNEKHIIPADVDEKIIKKVKYISKKVYSELNLKSIVRFDFLFDEINSKLYLNEINAIPGSIANYLFESDNILMIDLVEILVEQYKLDFLHTKKLISKYNDDFISNLKAK